MKKFRRLLKKLKSNLRCNTWTYIVPLFYIGIGFFIAGPFCYVTGYYIGRNEITNFSEILIDKYFEGVSFTSFFYGIIVVLAGVLFSIKKPPIIRKKEDIMGADWDTFSFRLKWRAETLFTLSNFRAIIILIALLIDIYIVVKLPGQINSVAFEACMWIFAFGLMLCGIITFLACILDGMCKFFDSEKEELLKFKNSDVDTLNERG